MKRLMSVVLSMVVVLMMCGGAMAQECFNAQGSTLVPKIMYYNNSDQSWAYPYITLTNITNETVQCQVRIFDADGLDLTSLGAVTKGGINAWGVVSSGTGDFEIPAHCSRLFYLRGSSVRRFTVGYAEVQWSSNDPKARKALIGGVMIHRKDGANVTNTNYLINHGDPF